MPRGPGLLPRLSTIPPLSKQTEKEVRSQWDECLPSGKPKQICTEIKRASLVILEDDTFFTNCGTLEKINSGNCSRVSDKVLENVSGVRVLKIGDNSHFWIEYDGVHYDAEVPTGVDDPMDLPIFSRRPPEALLRWAKMSAKQEGRSVPETLEETITDVTDQR